MNAFANFGHWRSLAVWIALCVMVGVLTGLLFKPGGWYFSLEQPVFNPPAWLFAPVWTILYAVMGVAAWRVWCLPDSPPRTKALWRFAVQLLLNAAWTPVFFGLHSIGGALAIIVLMALAIVVTIQHFHPLDRIAAWLLAPYLAWVVFATALNASLFALNGKF
jgi:tryptophan-rich sensory protein